ncbi:MAG: LTA synthase family protein [Fidelibacterota bacterium]
MFWIIFFLMERILFVTYNLSSQGSVDVGELLSVLIHALRLDLSTAFYLLLPPFFYWAWSLFIPNQKGKVFLKAYFYLTVPVFSILMIVNLELYRQWGVKINTTAISYLHYPMEAWASVSSSPMVTLLLILIVFCGWFLLLAQKLVNRVTPLSNPKRGYNLKDFFISIGKIVTVLVILIIGLRGGVQLAPINQSFAYFSPRPFLNQAAVNTLWNLGYSFTKANGQNPYSFMSGEIAEHQIDSLYSVGSGKPVLNILNKKHPNIVLVILEGWSVDLLSVCGKNSKLTINLDNMVEKGVLFPNIYATGNRTDRGLVAILSGFPSQPRNSIIKEPKKTQTLAFLPQILANAGYSTSFYYGGETEFANIKSYLLNSGYQSIIDKNQFNPEDMNSKWGAHDHVVFNRVLKDLKMMQSPFFTTVLTLSSHEPFEVPMETVIQGRNQKSLYKNSVVYTDRSIGNFIKAFEAMSFFNNTLFIFLSDHGFRLNRGPLSQWSPDRYHIPLVFYGPVIKPDWRGRRVQKIGSQTDFAVTLLKQLGLDYSAFRYGKDLLNSTTSEFAFYVFNEGFGWISPDVTLLYDYRNKKDIILNPSSSTAGGQKEFSPGKAYLQVLFQDYLDR